MEKALHCGEKEILPYVIWLPVSGKPVWQIQDPGFTFRVILLKDINSMSIQCSEWKNPDPGIRGSGWKNPDPGHKHPGSATLRENEKEVKF
jgi:hypothetical protein